jgi:hypothetical protein
MTMQSVLIGVQRENLFSTITSVFAFGSNFAAASYQIDGGIERANSGGDFGSFIEEYDWLIPRQFGYNYEVRATNIGGGPMFGTFNTFFAAESGPTWGVEISQFGQVRQGDIIVDFRRKGDTNILLSKQVTFYAETT